jgi:hypothetical protein
MGAGRKGIANSSVYGLIGEPNGTPNPDGGGQPILLDIFGRQIVQTVYSGEIDSAVLFYSSAALVTTALISSFCLRLLQIAGYNAGPSLYYFGVYDETIAPLSVGAVPRITIPVPGNNTSFAYSIPMPMQNNNLIAAFSSTPFAYTALASPYLYCTAQYMDQ